MFLLAKIVEQEFQTVFTKATLLSLSNQKMLWQASESLRQIH